MGLLDILQQYAGGTGMPAAQTDAHFDEVARSAPRSDLGSGIAAALRSDATPPLGQIVGDLFGRADSQQRAGMLNQLVQALGPGALSGIAGGALGRIFGSGSAPSTITPEQAAKLSPADASAIAAHAEKHDPSVIDRLGQFYAEHPTLVKSLGAAALGIVMSHMGNRRQPGT